MVLINEASKEKLRGGFYTPKDIADFILKWAINGNKEMDILEPSCGDGVFLQIMKEKNIPYNSISAVEFDETEYQKALSIDLENSFIVNDDFHNYCLTTRDKFDLIIGNPPYIRYQYFSKDQQTLAEKIFRKSGLKYTKLTNAWVSFVVGSSQLLKEKGKIAFVLPAELLQPHHRRQPCRRQSASPASPCRPLPIRGAAMTVTSDPARNTTPRKVAANITPNTGNAAANRAATATTTGIGTGTGIASMFRAARPDWPRNTTVASRPAMPGNIIAGAMCFMAITTGSATMTAIGWSGATTGITIATTTASIGWTATPARSWR